MQRRDVIQYLYKGEVTECTSSYSRGSKIRQPAFTLEQYRKLHRYMRSKAYPDTEKHGEEAKYDSQIVRTRHMLRAYILYGKHWVPSSRSWIYKIFEKIFC